MDVTMGGLTLPGVLVPGSGTGLLWSTRKSVKAGTEMTPCWYKVVRRVGVGLGFAPADVAGRNVSPCMGQIIALLQLPLLQAIWCHSESHRRAFVRTLHPMTKILNLQIPPV